MQSVQSKISDITNGVLRKVIQHYDKVKQFDLMSTMSKQNNNLVWKSQTSE